ncbi:hypothetical protein [Mycobacterium sp.]|uniref:hypothetical protein n=1 Tax=Mycobacterium sp. TaxID=1785 RepID=UPI002CC71A8C|nr:hypothetical protein [Mycobacterium sp.]HTY32470.1 hypothetical protein [Mycobacterium sp.]
MTTPEIPVLIRDPWAPMVLVGVLTVARIWLVIIGMTEIVSAFITRNGLQKADKAVAGTAHGAPLRAA